MGAVNALVQSGYAPLTAMILSSRGIEDARQAHAYLGCDAPLDDPFLMKDMDLAAGRVGLAMTRGEKIAVFGDYDVDGITATCLLTDFLRRHQLRLVYSRAAGGRLRPEPDCHPAAPCGRRQADRYR